MSGGFIKIDGSHRKIRGAWTKIDGVWRKGSTVKSKVDGVWRESWRNAFDAPSFLSYPSKIQRGETFTWVCEEIPGAVYEINSRYNEGNWRSFYFTQNTGQLTVNTSVNNSSLQLRVRAVAPTTHDKESAWLDGPVRQLGAITLDKPTGLSYPTSITRGDKIKVKWTAEKDVKYTLQAVYNDGASTATVYSGIGGGSVDYTVSTGTQNTKLQFKIMASKTGYNDSAWATGSKVTLKKEQLASVVTINAPNPYNGQTITVSWTGVTHSKQFLLEVQYNNGTWNRAYFGANKSYSYTVSDTAKSIQWRVRAENPDYEPGAWKYSTQIDIALPPLKTTVWKATETRSWRSKSDWGWRDPGDVGDPDSVHYVYQGAWNEPPWWGNHRGVALFNYSSMQKTLKNKKIVKTRIYFYRINKGGYVAGQKINLWTHNYASIPSGKPTLSHVQGPFSSFARGEGKWITVDNEVAERIRDGKAKGIALYREDELGYLYMSSNVKIEVQYR